MKPFIRIVLALFFLSAAVGLSALGQSGFLEKRNWFWLLVCFGLATGCIHAASQALKVFRFRLTRLFWLGVALLTIGSGPLLAVIGAAALHLTRDRNPNPIGFGMMAMFTFYPALACILGGVVESAIKFNRAINQPAK